MARKPSDDLIGALVRKAQEGVGGESLNARRALERLCKKHDLDFDAVMNGDEAVDEHMLEYKRGHEDLMAQIIMRYGTTPEHPDVMINKRARFLFFTGTKQRYIEVLNAYEVLSSLYEKEKRKMRKLLLHGFVRKHDLYRKYPLPDPERIGKEEQKSYEEQKKEMEESLAIDSLAKTMEDAEINPRLESQNK